MEGIVTIVTIVVIAVLIHLILRKAGIPDDTILRWVPGTVGFIGMIVYGLYIHGPLHMVLLIAIACFI